MTNMFPKLHNAAWPGLVGKEAGTDNPPIDFDTMLGYTADAEVDGNRFDGIDLFVSAPHVDIDSTREDLSALADKIAAKGLVVGSLVAPVWPPTGGGSAMGDEAERGAFLTQVRKACRIARDLRDIGIRPYGIVRIDSACGVGDWSKDPDASQKVTIPYSTAPGSYFLLVEADSEGDVVESNEGNNVLETALTVDQLCLPDAYEPNDLLLAEQPWAPLVEPPLVSSLALCPYDLDWFAIQVPGGTTLRVRITFDATEGDLDLRLYDPAYSKTLPIAKSATSATAETILYPVPVGGIYLVRVHGFDAAAAAYELEIAFE